MIIFLESVNLMIMLMMSNLMTLFISLFMLMSYGMIIMLLVDWCKLYMLNVDNWMWCLHVLNYVVESLCAI